MPRTLGSLSESGWHCEFRQSETLAQAIRGAQLKVIPHAGHLVAFEQPDEFNQVVKEWLTGTDLRSLDGNN